MKKLVKRLKGLLKNEEIQDIIIFGSKAKGRLSPEDIDIAILLKQENPEIKKIIIQAVPNADVQFITIGDIYKSIFFTLIKEGFSVRKEEYLHNMYNMHPVNLYKYNLKQLSASKKVMFERGIKSIKGIVRLSNSVVLVPIAHSAEFDDFLKNWGLDIETRSYELVPMLRKEEFV